MFLNSPKSWLGPIPLQAAQQQCRKLIACFAPCHGLHAATASHRRSCPNHKKKADGHM